MATRCTRHSGFTLVESLISLIIISLGIVASVQLISASVVINQRSQSISAATQRAQHELELLAKIPYTKLITGNVAGYYQPSAAYPQFQSTAYTGLDGQPGYKWAYATDQGELPHPTIARNVSMALTKYQGYSHLYQAVITVQWEVPNRANQNITLTTLVADKSATPSVKISPTTGVLAPGETLQFTAVTTALSPDTVTWTITEVGGGTITNAGLYTAPNTAGTYHIKATSTANNALSATATVTVKLPGGVTVTPDPVSIYGLMGAQFSASVQNMTPTTVTWQVQEAGGGSVDASGYYTAPATPGTYHVIATSVADVSLKDTATVVVTNPASIAIVNPAAGVSTLKKNTGFTFAAAANGLYMPVTWEIVSGDGSFTGGTGVNPTTYKTPNTKNVTVQIRARLKANPAIVSPTRTFVTN